SPGSGRHFGTPAPAETTWPARRSPAPASWTGWRTPAAARRAAAATWGRPSGTSGTAAVIVGLDWSSGEAARSAVVVILRLCQAGGQGNRVRPTSCDLSFCRARQTGRQAGNRRAGRVVEHGIHRRREVRHAPCP